MLTIPQYLLESSFCLVIFYGFYYLLLSKETFFQLNRAYLVATPIFALSIPLLNISFQKDAPEESLATFFYPAIESANNLNELVWEQMRTPTPVFSLSVADVLMAIYLIGAFLMAFSLLRGLWNLSQIIRNGKQSKNSKFTLVETQNNFPAASFFGYIFWNQQITDDQKLILEHEKVHIRQWHSLDVLLMEICVIIKWFNPLIYWFRNALKATHEYIADQYVIQQKSNVQDYATLLVNQRKKTTPTLLTNTFYSMTAKRLKMMLQRPSKKAHITKYLLILPLVASLMLLFSFNLLEEIPQVNNRLSQINEVISDLTETTVFEIEKAQENAPNLAASMANFANRASDIQVHFGEKKFGMSGFNPTTGGFHQNVLEPTEFLELLEQEIHFSINDHVIYVEEIDLLIPKFQGGKPIRLKTSLAKNFKFSATDMALLKANLERNDNIYFNGYSQEDVYTTEFQIRGDKIVENLDKKYQLFWGDVEIPIKHYDSDDNGTVGYEMELKEFLKVLRQPISITKAGKIFQPKEVAFTFYGNDALVFWSINKNKDNQWEYKENALRVKEELAEGDVIQYEKPKSDVFKIKLEGKKEMRFLPKDYEKIYNLMEGKVTVTLQSKDEFLLATSISIKNPSAKYQPPHKIKNEKQEVYNFQLITPITGKAILKIDTIKSAKTARLFRDNGKYKIIHIPDFQTIERVLDEKESVKEEYPQKIRPILYNSITKADLLPNYIIEDPTELAMKWGDLVAQPESDNLSLLNFHKNNGKSPKLLYKGKILPFSSLRLTIINKKSVYTKSFQAADFDTSKMNDVLSKVDAKTSIYLDKIQILDQGKVKHLQHRFLFKVGNAVLKSSFGKPKKRLEKKKSNETKISKSIKDTTDVTSFNTYPLGYNNQIVITKKKMKSPSGGYKIAYAHDMSNYIKSESKHLKGEDALAAFGEVGRNGIFIQHFKHKKRKFRKKIDTENTPLYVYYLHPSFPMLTHKLIYKDLDKSDLLSTKEYPPSSKQANLFGEIGKNGIIEIRFKYPKSVQFPKEEPVKITIKRSNPNWSKKNWVSRDSLYSVYLFGNMPISEVYKTLTGLPDNQLDFSKITEDIPLHISVHGKLASHQNHTWILQQIQTKIPFEVKKINRRKKVLVLKKGISKSLEEYEYFYKILPNIKSVIEKNQKLSLKTISPGYLSDYQRIIREEFELPFVDETGYFRDSAICLGLDISSIDNLRKQLKELYGLELVEEERMVEVHEVYN